MTKQESGAGLQIIDVNAWLGSWPFRYLYEDDAGKLDELLAGEGVERAYVGSPETVFNEDCREANRRLAKAVRGRARLRPVMTLNPAMPGRREELAEYQDDGARAIRIVPNYHAYGCASEEAFGLAEQVARAGSLVLMVQMRMEDERTHNPVCRVPGVPLADLVSLASEFPDLSIIAQCCYIREVNEAAGSPSNLLFDLSHIERMRTVTTLLKSVPAERVLFGSHAPFLYVRAAVMKLMAPDVPEDARAAIACENARRVFGV